MGTISRRTHISDYKKSFPIKVHSCYFIAKKNNEESEIHDISLNDLFEPNFLSYYQNRISNLNELRERDKRQVAPEPSPEELQKIVLIKNEKK